MTFHTLRPRGNEQHFADDIFKRIFFNENVWISIKISLKFVPKDPINNISTLVQIMVWRCSGDKPLSEPMMVSWRIYAPLGLNELKTIGHLFYVTSSFVHHFIPIGEFKLELQSRNAQIGSKSTIFLAVWPSNWTDDLEKQWGTYSMLPEALCIISYPLVNSNWSYSPEIPNWGQNQGFF